jgi:hypothetical protein
VVFPKTPGVVLAHEEETTGAAVPGPAAIEELHPVQLVRIPKLLMMVEMVFLSAFSFDSSELPPS